jgi:hypothetical protein
MHTFPSFSARFTTLNNVPAAAYIPVKRPIVEGFSQAAHTHNTRVATCLTEGYQRLPWYRHDCFWRVGSALTD